MRKEYDFSKARPNPYAKRLKRSTTVDIDEAKLTRHSGRKRLRRPPSGS
jgi:hypothetical protein